MTRSNDELNQFYATGVMPAHQKKEYVSKEEYFKARNTQTAPSAPTPSAPVANAPTSPVFAPPASSVPNTQYTPFEYDSDDLPF